MKWNQLQSWDRTLASLGSLKCSYTWNGSRYPTSEGCRTSSCQPVHLWRFPVALAKKGPRDTPRLVTQNNQQPLTGTLDTQGAQRLRVRNASDLCLLLSPGSLRFPTAPQVRDLSSYPRSLQSERSGTHLTPRDSVLSAGFLSQTREEEIQSSQCSLEFSKEQEISFIHNIFINILNGE